MLGKFSLDLIELGANCHTHGLDALPGSGVTERQPLALGHLHGDELPPARHQGLQRLLLWRWQSSDETITLGTASQHLSEFSQGLGVDAVGLGEIAHGFGEVPRLARIDDGDSKAGGLQGASQVALQATRGLHDDQIDRLPGQVGKQRIKARVVVGEGLDAAAHAKRSVEGLLGKVNADND